MASISSLSSSSSSSSVYGNRTYNIISGLASGMDTESLISGAVQGYQQKIQNLQNQNTKLQWQQEAYQSISDKLVEFYRNYATFAYSNNNLASSSFFNNAVNTTTDGIYSKLVSASGKSDSTVVLNAVKQLATAARYTHTANNLNNGVTTDSNGTTIKGDAIDVTDDNKVKVSELSGSLTFTYGTQKVSIDLGDREFFEKDGTFSAEALEDAIKEKLSEQKISTNGGSGSAEKYIGVTVEMTEDGKGFSIAVEDLKKAGNTVKISDATGKLEDLVGDLGDGKTSVTMTSDSGFTEEVGLGEYVSGQSITVTLDGKSKTISLDKFQDIKNPDEFIETLNKELKNAFGTVGEDGTNKIKATLDENGISFTVDPSVKNPNFSVTASNSDVGDVLGIGSGLASYVDTTKTLGELLGESEWNDLAVSMGVGDIKESKDDKGNTIWVDEEGNRVKGADDARRVDEDGNLMYDLVINDVKIGTYSKETELNTVINAINSNTDVGVNVSYSKTTNQFVFTAKETGAGGRVEIAGVDADGKTTLGAKLFGAVAPGDGNSAYEAGKDAQFIATINGQAMEFTRSSNSFDLDGMSVTVSGTFNEKASVNEGDNKVVIPKDPNDPNSDMVEVTDSVTFTSKTDADKIVEAVKKMVEDFNAIIKEVKSAYSDMPLEKSDGSRYEPLSDEDMEGMTESAIEAYEEKAKTGILFMDNDLSSLYNDLRNAITSSGADGATLRSIGIGTSYSDGLTTLTFDEQAFREALESDPDKVQEAFTKSKENGAATNGLMASITAITDKYAATTGSVKGILIEKAGSKYSPTAALDNTILDQMKEVEEQIAKWQDKMSNQVDYYTNKFTQLEMLINQMNSQSSALSGLMGG